MELNFNNASLLGFSQSNTTFESDFTFNVEKSISITGHLLDLSNTEGVSGIVTDTDNFIKSTKADPKPVQLIIYIMD